jgi:hypothetical protein
MMKKNELTFEIPNKNDTQSKGTYLLSELQVTVCLVA